MDLLSIWIISGSLALVALLAGGHLGRRWLRQRRDEAALEAKLAKGENLARSLHPVIDPDICIGSLSCLKACPEGDILGVVNATAKLVHADHCIGHGKCAAECPVDAIKLVFGTAERGVDLPEVDEFFESSRPGVHIVGELGGMGLIKNAMIQGLEVAERLGGLVSKSGPGVLIVGAGPAGIATSLGLKARGIPFRIIDQSSLGGTVAHYPRRKIAMSDVVELPLVGKFGKRQISKEELLSSWQRILAKTGIHVEEGLKVVGIDGADGQFQVKLDKGGVVPAAKVVLATGRRGSPRKLGVPGEEHEKVLYSLTDPEQFQGQKMLVVGGGDAAIEAAIQLAEESSAEVVISYRGEQFARCREANRTKIDALIAAGRIHSLLPSVVKEVRPTEVVLEVAGKRGKLANDFIIVNIGGELPLEFLAKAQVSLRRYHGEAPGSRPASETETTAFKLQRVEASARRDRKEVIRTRIFRTAYAVVGAAILGYLAWKGRAYYPLDRLARHDSPLHPFLKSAGVWGHSVGIAATAFMLSNFLYAARKRWKALDRFGSIRGWLDFHVFVGFMSPLVIAFHAAFQSNNLLASGTAGALLVVVGTGVVGRYIYGLVPQDGGKSVELADLIARVERLRDDLGPLLEEAGDPARALLARATAPVKGGSFLALFLAVPLNTVVFRVRLLLVKRRFRDVGHFATFRDTVVRLSRLRWQIRFYASLKRLLRGWRAFHASLAIFLILAIAAHIALSLYLGYGLLHWR